MAKIHQVTYFPAKLFGRCPQIEQLAAKIGTMKSYISKIGNVHADIQLSTLFRIFGGLGKHVSLTVL